MGRVIATAWGVRGDVTPYVAIGAELKKRGHDVQLVSSPAYEGMARDAGLSFLPVGTVEQYEALVREPGLWDRRTYVKKGIQHFLPLVRAMYEAVMTASRGRRDAVLLPSREGAWIAREKLGLPAVALRLSPSKLGSRLDPKHPSRPFPAWTNPVVRTRWGLRVIRALKIQREILRALRGGPRIPRAAQAFIDEIRRVRALAGLPEYPASLEAVQPSLVICLWPSWFSPRQEDWPKNARLAGFPFHPRPPRRSAAPVRDAAPRPIVFIRGSAASSQKKFFAEAADCCRRLGSPGVLLTPHRDNVPSELPPRVRHVSFAPLGELFSRARAVVHHGGVGTMAYGFAAGVPQLVAPMVGDQFDLGYRMERLGAGRLLTEEPVTGGRLAEELERLCGSKEARSRCESLRERMDLDAGCSLAADWVEEVMESIPRRAARSRRAVLVSGEPSGAAASPDMR